MSQYPERSPFSNTLHSFSLNILQWNCHSLGNKLDVLRNNIHNIDVLALSETWLNPSPQIYLRGFHILREDNSIRNSGGLLLAIRNTIPFKRVEDCFSIHNRLECMAITIPLKNEPLLIVSLYRHPHDSFSSEEWNGLFQFCSNFPSAIIVGDFNAHHHN